MFRFVLFIALTFTHSVTLTQVSYANDQRPFWTEQSSFTFDDTLYAVGVATQAPSVEAGRQAAFTNGLEEIRNYAQVHTLDGLLIDTQMTYEEPQANGTVSIWRLLRVSLVALRSVKESAREVQQVSRMVAPSAPPSQFAGAHKQRDRSVMPEKSTLKPPGVKVNLPASSPVLTDIPTRLTRVIRGWTRDSHGRLAVESQERSDWHVELLKPSDLTYATARK